jgi:methylphosphotriester-DNA--protein-cysteine methyltransferase
MRRFLALVAGVGFLCTAAVRAQDDPGASFQEAQALMKEALQSKVASERASLEARQKYEQALSTLKGLKTLSPNWNADEVSKAAAECGKALAELTGDSTRAAGVAAAVKTAQGAAFIGHKKSKKYHRADCRYAVKASEGSRTYFNTREEAVAAGYSPCKTCKPDETGAAATSARPATEEKPEGASSKAARAPETPLSSGPFFGIASSKKVHRADCKWSKKVADKNKVFFAAYADAVKEGYSPCKLCRPDEAPGTAPVSASGGPATAPAAVESQTSPAAEGGAPAAKAAPAGKYVASSNGKTFHRADCAWAKGIDPSALVTYKTKEEAIAAGKKPCRICKP